VAVHTDLGHRGPVPRDDVALTLLELLRHDAAVRVTFELLAGDVPAAVAVRTL
jgi:cytosine deaminase